jgi:hypothetical protein
MATFTVHQWPDLVAGLAETRRVMLGPVLVLSCDPDVLDLSWLQAYAPEMIHVEARRYPGISAIEKGRGSDVEIMPTPIPLHCSDGFSEAYYGLPERLLCSGARRANSADFIVEMRFVEDLSRDLQSGEWDKRKAPCASNLILKDLYDSSSPFQLKTHTDHSDRLQIDPGNK